MMRSEAKEFLADIDGLPVLVRFLFQDVPADWELAPEMLISIHCCRARLRRWSTACADRACATTIQDSRSRPWN